MSWWNSWRKTDSNTPTVRITDGADRVRVDAWGNRSKQLGTFNDVSTYTAPQTSPPIDIRDAGELYRRGPYARVCNLFALWTWGALRFNITGIEPAQEKIILDRLDELDYKTKGMQADDWGMGFGWSPLYMVVDDTNSGDASEPDTRLKTDNIRKIYALHNVPPKTVTPLSVTADPRSENWRQPEMYRVQFPAIHGAVNTTLRIHESRLLPFWGIKDAQIQRGQAVNGLWDGAPRPYADQIYDELRLIGALESGANRAALELVTSVFKFGQGSGDLIGGMGDPSNGLQQRLDAVSRSLGIARKVALNEGEEFDIKALTTTGWKDLSDFGFTMLSLSTGLPKALLFGEAPTGLSTDKGSWWAQLERTIQSRRDSRVLPVLSKLIEAVMVEQGIKVADWGIEFLPLGEMTDLELAQIREAHTRADVMLYQSGVLESEDLRSRYEGGRYRSSLELDTEEETSADDMFAALMQMESGVVATSVDTPAAQPTPMDPLNGAQLSSALMVLGQLKEGIIAPGAAKVLLSGVLPADAASAAVDEQMLARKAPSEVEIEKEQAKQGVTGPPESPASPSPGLPADDPLTLPVEGPADSEGQDSEQAKLAERRGLAEMMTMHDIDRCSHGRVNQCDVCGVERTHQLALDENGEPCRDENGKPIWAIVWRAQGDLPNMDSLDAEFRQQRFKIPSGASGNAKQALEWKKEHGSEVKGMQADKGSKSTGWKRARQLAKGGTISGADLITIAAWFARHGAESSTKKVAPEFKDEPWRDNGYVSWQGWGGDTMRSFATDVVERNR